MVTLIGDLQIAADWISKALVSSGYRADFTPASLKEIERFIDEHTINGMPRPGGLLSEQLGTRVFALGAYVGEVIRRARGGVWYADDSDPEGEANVELRLSSTDIIWPTQRVMKRITSGEEHSLVAYGVSLGLTLPQ